MLICLSENSQYIRGIRKYSTVRASAKELGGNNAVIGIDFNK